MKTDGAMRNNGEQDVSEVTNMDRMFQDATAFGSDVSSWVQYGVFGPLYIYVPPREQLFNCMVSCFHVPRRAFT